VHALSLIRRVGVFAGTAVFGAFLSVVSTLQHRAWVPWGAVLGLALIAGFGGALRLLGPGRSLALVGMASVVVVQLALSSGNDGSLIVTAGPIGYGYTIGVALIGALVVSWPDLRASSRYDRSVVVSSREDHS
jgi:hypothetical protein